MFNHIAKFGDKVANTVVAGLKIGQKATGLVHKYGEKVRDFGKAASKIPGVGGELGKAVGIVGGVTDAAGSLNKMMKGAESGVRGTQSALHAGNTQQALGIMRDTAKDEFAAGKSLKTKARSTLERARK
jgi:hypothetical protein